VGKKKREYDLSTEEYIAQLKTDLKEDVFKVTIEARGSGRGLGIYDETGRIRVNRLDSILEEEGLLLSNLSDYIINTIPHQGTNTVRTEESISATLAMLNIIRR